MFFATLKRAIFAQRHEYDPVNQRERDLFSSFSSSDSELEPFPKLRDSPPLTPLEKKHMEESGSAQHRVIDPRIVSDAIIGLSDGLTVPFALTAGLSGFGTTKVVIFGGLAELIAGAISMGLGGYLAGKNEIEAYESSLRVTRNLLHNSPDRLPAILAETFQPYLRPYQPVEPLIAALDHSPHSLLPFLMRFHHNLPDPPPNRAYTSAITIALGYFLGGLIPLLPYMFVDSTATGLWISCAVMAFALFIFGVGKRVLVEEEGWGGSGVKRKALKSGVEMLLLGSAAAAAAVLLVRAFSTNMES